MDQLTNDYESPEILGSFAAQDVLGSADGLLPSTSITYAAR